MKYLLMLVTCLVFLPLLSLAEMDEDGFTGPNNLRNNQDVTTYREDMRGVPVYVEGNLAEPAAKGNEVNQALLFLDNNKSAFKMVDPSRELQPTRLDVDELGMRHVRFQQHYQGIKVIGGVLLAHFTASGSLKTVNGHFEPGIKLEVDPVIDAGEAEITARNDLREFFGEGEPGEWELVVFPWENKHYLCWRAFLYSDTPMGRWEYFVDAVTGEVIFRANRIMDTDAIGTGIGVMGDPRTHIDTDYNGSTYRMIDYTRQLNNDPHHHQGQMPDGNYLQTNIAGSSLPGSVATDADNYWADPNVQAPAVDGHVYSALVYDWWLSQFNRNSYTNTGTSMLTIVNYSGEGDNNAYWDGSRIVVWSWSSGWRSLAGCPDVIAHEWGHAVTEYTSGLVYQKEPGALNEAFSDMMGAAFEFAHDSMDTPDWYMGENAEISGNGFRSMSNPHEFGDPDYYGTSDPYWIDVVGCTPSWLNDYCGVHTNSGVGNKWFYLLSDGGTHHGVTVGGIGVENAIKVAYRANAFYWNSNTDYHEGALGTISAADDLDPTGTWATQVAKAWTAVGVSVPLPSVAFAYPTGVPSVLTPNQPATFEVEVNGALGGTPVSGSGELHYSLDGGSYTTVSMTEISANYYEATLPAAPCGSIYEFYLSAEEEEYGVYYDPDPTDPFEAVAAVNVVVVFEDNFESDQGWTVSGDALDGQWQRGIPVGGGDRGDPPTDFDGSGRCYLTDNVDDNSDVDDGTTILTSPVFDLSQGDARIHYARWYSNNFGNDPFNDVFEVYISNNNGTSWTLVETVGPVEQASGGWYEHSFWVSDFVTPSSQMRMRFDASDLGDGSVVEAGVDAFSVTVYECGGAMPQIVTDTLPDWTVGSYYSQQLQATGGTGTLTWTDQNGDLDGTGLILSTTGLLSGTPTTPGPISFTAEVTDEELQSDQELFNFYINSQVQVTTESLPDWTAGHPFNQQLQSSGGTGGKTWVDKNGDLSGTGLSLSASGLVSGTPVTTGQISFTAQVTDETLQSDEKLFSFFISSSVAVTTGSLPDWTAGQPYSQQMQATGGTGTLTWTDKNGDLDGTGLTLSIAGLLSGTPTSTGQVTFTARVTDDVAAYDEKIFNFNINAPVEITTGLLPDWTVGQAYSQQLQATGGTGILSWIDKNGDLVGTGLTLSASGLVSGVPNATGQMSFTAEVTDELSVSAEELFTFSINSQLNIETADLPDWTSGHPYNQQLQVTGGTGTRIWSDKNGDLAGTGLNLSVEGLLSGTPVTSGLISFTAAVSDQGGDNEEKPFSFTINPELVIITDTLPGGVEGDAYSQQLEVSGGTGDKTWSDLNDDLQGTGLVLTAEGLLSGTPLASGQVSFTAHVEDAVGAFDEIPLGFFVEPAYICGDIDASGEEPNVADLTYLVDYIFRSGAPPPIMEAANVDGVNGISVADITTLVVFLFQGGTELNCN